MPGCQGGGPFGGRGWNPTGRQIHLRSSFWNAQVSGGRGRSQAQRQPSGTGGDATGGHPPAYSVRGSALAAELGLTGAYALAPPKDGDRHPRYELVHNDSVTVRRSERRFLSVMAYDGGRWVLSEWEGVLAMGPLAPDGTDVPPSAEGGEWQASGRTRGRGDLGLTVAALDSSPGAPPEDDVTSDSESEEADDMYTDRNGMCYCTEHRRERCGVCCFDFTVMNNMRRAENRGQTPDYDAVAHASYDAADAEMRAVVQAYAAEGGSGTLELGGDTYKPITWDELRELRGAPATGRTLEVRVQELVPFLRVTCECKDRKGKVRTIAFYSSRAPDGLRQGCVLRWRNPHYHWFMGGQEGARVEDDDLQSITCSSE